MKYYYDLHIHSCLSPCGEEEMTPNNIVNMSLIKGLHVISVTDHNSIDNIEVIQTIGKEKGLLVIPGIEIQTKEEVHMLGYFQSLEDIQLFYKSFEAYLSPLPNNPKFFGKQLVMNKKDEIIRENTKGLIWSVDLNVNETLSLINRHNGVGVFAHIDKSSTSVLSNLGFIPKDINMKTLEVIDFEKMKSYSEAYQLISNSDAHMLKDISEPINFMNLETLSIEAVIQFLRKGEFI